MTVTLSMKAKNICKELLQEIIKIASDIGIVINTKKDLYLQAI